MTNGNHGAPKVGTRVAIYARVSTEEQTDQNQIRLLEQWASDKGWDITGYYKDVGSAWQHADQKELRRLLNDCRLGKVETVLVYDLSRLSRGGPYASIKAVRDIMEYDCQVKSYRESWLELIANPMMREAIIGLWGFINESESRDKSERTKAGMARAKAEGKHVGRPKKKGIEKTATPFCIESGVKNG